MMIDDPAATSSLGAIIGGLARTGIGALKGRGELLALEWQEEKARLAELLVWTAGVAFLGIMGVVMITATILILIPAGYRIYGAAGFAILYCAAALVAWGAVKRLVRHEPFAESLAQAKKDATWLNSLK
ncbi:MAG TPA: phage holin family protein [Verrucomicrobiae bacterium]|nr:phage holin family protein [Verrucomicrobiae bacterium]